MNLSKKIYLRKKHYNYIPINTVKGNTWFKVWLLTDYKIQNKSYYISKVKDEIFKNL
jgi:hypothetical protein